MERSTVSRAWRTVDTVEDTERRRFASRWSEKEEETEDRDNVADMAIGAGLVDIVGLCAPALMPIRHD